MAIDTTPSTVATSALQALPFSSLIGGPLDAAIKAQALAAQTSWEFIQNVGLMGPTPDQMVARNVTFQYNKNGQMTQLIVPLLTIVPIPYIAIDNVQIDFKANISASASTVSTTSDSSSVSAGGSAKATLGWGIFSVSADFQANYSSKKDSTASSSSKYSVEYTMDVSVHAGQSDMPAGLAAILNILQGSITDAGSNGNFTFTPTNPSFDVSTLTKTGGPVSIPITAVVKDNNGLVYANQPMTMTGGTLPAFLTGANFPISGTTDKNGTVTFTVTGTAAPGTSYSPGVAINLTVASTANAAITDTVALTFTGDFPTT